MIVSPPVSSTKKKTTQTNMAYRQYSVAVCSDSLFSELRLRRRLQIRKMVVRLGGVCLSSLSLSLLTTEPFFYSFPHKHNSLFLLNLLITSIFMTIVSPTCQTQAFHFLVSKNDTTSSSFPAKNRSPCPLLLFLPPVPSAFSAVRRRSIAVATSVA